MKFSTVRITSQNLSRWQTALEEFESHFVYPLGEDSFTIDHGVDYLAFFRRMGNPHVYACVHQNKIVAMGSGIIHHRLKAWYLCDMKVHPDFRGNKLTKKLFLRYFFPNYFKSQKGFALTMEKEGVKNPITTIMEKLPLTPLKQGARLVFFYEDASSTLKALPLLSNSRKSIGFSSLKGVKDLVLKSSGKPLPLLHMEWDDSKPSLPQEGSLHMWALADSDPLVNSLAKNNITPKASGLIFHHRLGKVNWSELRTSEL